MKHVSTLTILLIAILSLQSNLSANTLSNPLNEKIGIVQADDHSKEKLYSNAKTWLSTKCADGSSFNKHNETTKDLLVTTCSITMADHSFTNHGKFASTSDGALKFNVTIDFKDGKYRYTIHNLNYEFSVSGHPTLHGTHSFPISNIDIIPERKVVKIEQEADEKVQEFIADLNKNTLGKKTLTW